MYEPKRKPVSLLDWFTFNIRGPYVHCEIVFVKDMCVDSLLLSIYQSEGYPEFKIDRSYLKACRLHKLHWYEFTGMNYVDVMKIRKTIEDIVSSKQYRTSAYKMLKSSLPSFINWGLYSFSKWYLKDIDKSDDGKEVVLHYDDEETETYCVEMCVKVLQTSFPDRFKNISLNGNGTDFVNELVRNGHVRKLDEHEFPKLKNQTFDLKLNNKELDEEEEQEEEQNIDDNDDEDVEQQQVDEFSKDLEIVGTPIPRSSHYYFV